MKREEMLARARSGGAWDLLVIGGGATGAGVAVDAATRGYRTLLVERDDFGKGTSSRSTKLVHGGVRYLEQGNLPLVTEALHERGRLRRNAPHLVSNLPFIVPNYAWWEAPFYAAGLKLYDLLAGRQGFGHSRMLSRDEAMEALPTLRPDGLRGAVEYHDGQFDDTRLLIHLVMTAADHGATVVNRAAVVALTRDGQGRVTGAMVEDRETGECFDVVARVVVNATGIFTDEVRRMADASAPPMIGPSQGIHLVLDGSFLQAEAAILVPHTTDHRVMFAVPWHGHTLIGTTDTKLDHPEIEPRPRREEIDFLLETAGHYLSRPPRREDILSVFAGIRPLVIHKGADAARTATLARDHVVEVEPSGLLTVAGGKWTTYRRMAEDCVDRAAGLGGLPEAPCATSELRLHGWHADPAALGTLAVYGSDAEAIEALVAARPELGHRLHPKLPVIAAEVVWAARAEMARTVEDILARRTRALFLRAGAAMEMAGETARLLAEELGRDAAWIAGEVKAFEELARGYLPGG